MRPAVVGLMVGIALGFAAAFGGFGAFLTVALLGLLGLLVGMVAGGQLDLTPYLGGRRRTHR